MVLTKIRKSGNSMVAVLPPHYIREKGLHAGQEVEFFVLPKELHKSAFGRGKHLKIDAQKAKDFLRTQW
ncbi:MAG TPA: hypothetical protein VJB12_01340 [Candidatus Nanoarchaeia archaeon]|nr:hypothetical protein [Candidatus Nanoarchaeia archaeon]